MASKRERDLIKACRNRQKKEKDACGVVFDLYQFTVDASADVKSGKLFQTTSKKRISFDPNRGITMTGSNQGVDAKFWVHKLDMRGQLERMIRLSLTLKHEAILRPILCAESGDTPNSMEMITACLNYDKTFVKWLSEQNRNAARGCYLSDDEKNMIISLVTAIKEIWKNNCTSDTMHQPDNYVMVGKRIKILPFCIRVKVHGDDETNLRNGLADFLQQHIAPFWQNDEFASFIRLLRNNAASYEDILGHPVLLRPAARQAMYRQKCPSLMTQDQIGILNDRLRDNANEIWPKLPITDPVLKEILAKTKSLNKDAEGALHLARVASCHYIQNLKEAHPGDWLERLRQEPVDKWLTRNFPKLLCNRYNLGWEADYINASPPGDGDIGQ